jgi:hypothetical protein
MKIKLLTAILLLAIVPTTFALSDADIIGTYNCTGNDPTLTPSAFTGKIIISKPGQAYLIQESDTGPTPAGLTYQEIQN